MVRAIVTDRFFLSQRSGKATKDDLQAAQDLRDTLAALQSRCVGLAANMIGVRKCIIAFLNERGEIEVMLNPVITQKMLPYQALEGCVALKGAREVNRWQVISVRYQDEQMQTCEQMLSGMPAQTIQHEIDHLCGILV